MSGPPIMPAGLGDVLARVAALDTRLRTMDPGWAGLGGDLSFPALLTPAAGTNTASAMVASAPATPGTASATPGTAAGAPVGAPAAMGLAGTTTIAWAPRQVLQPAPIPTTAISRTGGASGPRVVRGGSTAKAPAWTGHLVNPLPRGNVTLPFGPTTFALEPEATVGGISYAHFHDGLDLGAPLGSPVFAAADGTVIAAGRQSDGAVVVRIRHADGSVTVYGHLDPALPVAAGDSVTAGQAIGAVGLTGKTTGPLLHFELLVDGVAIDPAPAIIPEGNPA